MKECKATGKLIINPAKARFWLLSLDIKKAKQYNNPDNKHYDFHFLSLLSGVKFKPQGANLWRTPQRIISNLYKQKILHKIKFKIFFILIGFIHQALANPIDTMDRNITKLNELHTQQNQNYEKYMKVKINTLTDISQSIFLLKQNNELLFIEQKIGAVNGQ